MVEKSNGDVKCESRTGVDPEDILYFPVEGMWWLRFSVRSFTSQHIEAAAKIDKFISVAGS